MEINRPKIVYLNLGVLIFIIVFAVVGLTCIWVYRTLEDPNAIQITHMTEESLNILDDFGKINESADYTYYTLNRDNCTNETFKTTIKSELNKLVNAEYGKGVCLLFANDCEYGTFIEFFDFHQINMQSMPCIFNDGNLWIFKSKPKIVEPSSTSETHSICAPMCGTGPSNEELQKMYEESRSEEQKSKLLTIESCFIGLYIVLGFAVIFLIFLIFVSLKRT